jgi:hypothetical protein
MRVTNDELSDDKWLKEVDKRLDASAHRPPVSNGNGSQLADKEWPRPFDDVEKEFYKQLHDDSHDEARRLNEHLEDMANRRNAWQRIAGDLRSIAWNYKGDLAELKIRLEEPGEHSDV